MNFPEAGGSRLTLSERTAMITLNFTIIEIILINYKLTYSDGQNEIWLFVATSHTVRMLVSSLLLNINTIRETNSLS
jgi:hypothetical protein